MTLDPLLLWPLHLTRHSLLVSPLAIHVYSGCLLSASAHGSSLLNPVVQQRQLPAHRHQALCFIFEACGLLPRDFTWSSEAGLKGQENLASRCGLALRWGGCDLKASRPVAAPDVLNALKSPFDKPCKKHGVSLDSHLIFGRLVTHLFTRFGVESLLAIYKVVCHSWHRFHYTCSGE